MQFRFLMHSSKSCFPLIIIARKVEKAFCLPESLQSFQKGSDLKFQSWNHARNPCPDLYKISRSVKEVTTVTCPLLFWKKFTVNCFSQLLGKGAWPNNSVSLLERAFGEISRSLDRTNAKDQDFFYALGGFDILAKIYKVALSHPVFWIRIQTGSESRKTKKLPTGKIKK